LALDDVGVEVALGPDGVTTEGATEEMVVTELDAGVGVEGETEEEEVAVIVVIDAVVVVVAVVAVVAETAVDDGVTWEAEVVEAESETISSEVGSSLAESLFFVSSSTSRSTVELREVSLLFVGYPLIRAP